MPGQRDGGRAPDGQGGKPCNQIESLSHLRNHSLIEVGYSNLFLGAIIKTGWRVFSQVNLRNAN